jgi:HSP20 family molecular chaperone IbpA
MTPEFKQLVMPKGLRVSAAIPGLRAGDLEIIAEGRILRITSRKGCSVGAFEAEVEVPFAFDEASARAEYFSGELRVFLPRDNDC